MNPALARALDIAERLGLLTPQAHAAARERLAGAPDGKADDASRLRLFLPPDIDGR